MRNVKDRDHAFLLLCDRSCVKMTDRFPSRRYSLSKDSKTIIELDYHKNIVILQCLADQLLVDLLATDKSRYFAQPRPIIDNYWLVPKRLHSSRAWFEGEATVKFVYLFVDNQWGQRVKRFQAHISVRNGLTLTQMFVRSPKGWFGF